MRNEIISEIYLTTKNVTSDSWLTLINAISRLNGIFRKWYFYITIEKNEVRYFVKTSHLLPPIINELGDFLIKKCDSETDNLLDLSARKSRFFIFTNKEKNILDAFDKGEYKYNEKLKLAKMSILYFYKNHFFIKTHLFFEKLKNNKLLKKRALFAIPNLFLSIDFSIYSRFFYRKNANEYLDIEKTLPFFRTDTNNSILKVDTFPYLADNYYLSQTSYDFDKHSIIIGSSGTGKSKLVSSMIFNVSKFSNGISNYKFIVIDPHAAIENDIGGLEKTKIIDFKTQGSSSDLFMNTSKKDIVASTELILSLFQTLMDSLYNSKLERVLRHCIYILMEGQILNFENLKKLIIDMEYRNNLINKLQRKLPESITNFFLTDFNNLKSKSYEEAIAPIIAFIDEMELLPAFQTEGKKPQLKDIINDNFLTIFSLNQTVLGTKVTKTISGLIMQQILELIQSYSYDEHIVLVIDEVALVENPILSRFLSEARKYNLSLILIQQYFNQISEDVRKAIFANVANFYVFRVSKSDAIILENNLQMHVAVHDSYKIRLKILTNLKNRECIARISNNGVLLPAFKGRTIDFTPCPNLVVNQILKTDILFEDFKLNEAKDIESNSGFNINDSLYSLKELMMSQSSGRKDINVYE